MSQNPITIGADKTVRDAAKVMLEHHISILPVVDSSGNLTGVLTQSDFVGKEVNVPRALVSIKHLLGTDFYARDVEDIYKEAQQKKISEVMTSNVQTVSPEDSLDKVVKTMMQKNLKRLPVVVNDHLVGIITRRNLLQAFVEKNK